MVKSVWNLAHLKFGWIPGANFFIFWKFWFWALDTQSWTLNEPSKAITGQICLKFGTLIALVNPWGIFFIFRKFWFWALGTRPWTLNGPSEAITGQICLKFGTLIALVNPWGCFFHFSKILILGPGDPVLDPKWTQNLQVL